MRVVARRLLERGSVVICAGGGIPTIYTEDLPDAASRGVMNARALSAGRLSAGQRSAGRPSAGRLSTGRLGALAVIGLLVLAGCGRLNRAATINQVTTTSGAAAAAALEHQMASRGLPGARVTCAKSLIVNVGTTTSCNLTGAGGKRTVRFTFSFSNGAIDPASVKPS
jgi:hypothetical protein